MVNMAFDDLVNKHGPIKAMQILEALEAMKMTQSQRDKLLMTPQDRFLSASIGLMSELQEMVVEDAICSG